MLLALVATPSMSAIQMAHGKKTDDALVQGHNVPCTPVVPLNESPLALAKSIRPWQDWVQCSMPFLFHHHVGLIFYFLFSLLSFFIAGTLGAVIDGKGGLCQMP